MPLRAGVAQCHDFSVGSPCLLCGPPANDATIAETQHTAYSWVGFSQAKRAFCQGQCFTQSLLVECGRGLQRTVQVRAVGQSG